MFYQNRGMFTETLVNNTIEWYCKNNIAFFEKNYIPIKLEKINKSKKQIYGKIYKAKVDYYGVYKGKYIAFEVKETSKKFFSIVQLKKHQFYYLQTIQQFGGITFLLISFLEFEKIFLIKTDQLQKIKQQKISKITYDWCKKNCPELPICFPGIIKWLSFI